MARVFQFSISEKNNHVFDILQQWKRAGINLSDTLVKLIVKEEARKEKQYRQQKQEEAETAELEREINSTPLERLREESQKLAEPAADVGVGAGGGVVLKE